MNERFENVWDAIEESPEEPENMKLRSSLMTALHGHITRSSLSQTQASKAFSVTQPRISDRMRGKIDLFSIDSRINLLTAAVLRVELRAEKAA